VCVCVCAQGEGVQLQTTVNSLDGFSLVFGDDALLDVGLHLLVHEVLQLGEVIVWGRSGHRKTTHENLDEATVDYYGYAAAINQATALTTDNKGLTNHDVEQIINVVSGKIEVRIRVDSIAEHLLNTYIFAHLHFSQKCSRCQI